VFEKVSTKEIGKIKERLETELDEKNLPFRRGEEIESLINHLDTWLDWREDKEQEHYREVIKSES
jgi:HPt (histidine-containing phosphotransfer) domain-containing protein